MKQCTKCKNDQTIDQFYAGRGKDNSIGYNISNIVLSCRRCNSVKSDYFTEEEMIRIGKLLYYKKEQNEEL